MSEQNIQPRRPQEPETYVEDVEKAYFLANSNAKQHEERAAEIRKSLVDLVYGNNIISELATHKNKAKEGEDRDDSIVVHYINRDHRVIRDRDGKVIEAGNVWPGQKTITGPYGAADDEITYEQKEADQIYDVASLSYDVIKKTKR